MPHYRLPAGFYNIVQCTAPDCNIYPGEFDRLYYYEDPLTIGPDLVGKPHRVSIRYDDTSNTFTFGFDGRLTTPGPSDPGWMYHHHVLRRISGLPTQSEWVLSRVWPFLMAPREKAMFLPSLRIWQRLSIRMEMVYQTPRTTAQRFRMDL